MGLPTITRTPIIDDDMSGTLGTVFENAWKTEFYGQIDALIAKIAAVHICDGRLTLTASVPVTTADVTAATTLRWTPYKGNRVALYDGTVWNVRTFAELTIAVPSVVAQAYDVFAFDNSGTPTLELLEFANATITVTIATPAVVTWTAHGMSTGQSITFTTSGALPTGLTANTQYWITVIDANTFKLSTSPANVAAATFINTSGTQSGTHTGHQPQARATALVQQDGVLAKSGATTRRYLGTILTTTTSGQTEDSAAKRYVWNYYNRVRRSLRVNEGADSWTYSTNAYRQQNGNAANQLDLVIGVAEVLLSVWFVHFATSTTAGAVMVAIGQDSTATATTGTVGQWTFLPASTALQLRADLELYPTIGRHFYAALERYNAGGVGTFYGDNADGSVLQSGIYGFIEG